MILILGDVHKEFRLLFDRLGRLNPQPTAILQVGDLGGETAVYPDFPIPTYFIQGNHENWDTLYGKNNELACSFFTCTPLAKNLYRIGNGTMVCIEGLHVLGLGGNYSSKNYFKFRSSLQGGRRRHFTHEEVTECKVELLKSRLDNLLPFFRECYTSTGAFEGDEARKLIETPLEGDGVDILLTHEAPSPYVVKDRNCGIGVINEAIHNSRPKLHFFGHHHYDGEYEYEGVKSYGLGMGYLTGVMLDPITLEVKRINLT
jgi:hypothetical protein